MTDGVSSNAEVRWPTVCSYVRVVLSRIGRESTHHDGKKEKRNPASILAKEKEDEYE